MKQTILLIRHEIQKMDPNIKQDDPSFRVAEILLSSAFVGPSLNALKKFTGASAKLLRQVDRRARRNGIWKKNKVCVDWANKKTGGISFWLDVAVCNGWLRRK